MCLSESWTVIDHAIPTGELNLVSLTGVGVGAAGKYTVQ